MLCKIANCECQKQEISMHLLYWLSHQGIDIRPLFEKPYIRKKKDNTNHQSNEQNLDNEISEFIWSMPNIEQQTITENQQVQHRPGKGIKRSVPYKVPTSSNRRV